MRPEGIYKSHDLLTYISRSADLEFGQFSMVNSFVIGRFLTSTDSSKLIFHQGLYLCVLSCKVFMLGVGLEVNI